MNKNLTRRDFLKSTGAFGLSYGLAGYGLSTTGGTEAHAEMIISHGRIATQDGRGSFASSAAIIDGRFLAVGSDAEIMRLRGLKTQVVGPRRS